MTLERLKATRVELETYVQATNRTLTKQIDDRDDCAKLGNEYVVRARKAGPSDPRRPWRLPRRSRPR